MRSLTLSLCVLLAPAPTLHAADDETWWTLEQAEAVLERTRRVELAPDLSGLSPAARAAAARLLEAGAILHELYEESRHREALAARERLATLPVTPTHRAALEDLFYMFKGPIATTLDNERVPFLPVAPQPAGRNVYPWDIDRDSLEAWLAGDPARPSALLGVRTVVRATTAENLARDLKVLEAHPLLDGLHPGLRARLDELAAASSPDPFYALPYSVRWPDRTLRVHGLLRDAAAVIAPEDPDFADYLRLRALDLLTDDYEAGDASWVTGRFGNLNAQIGSYETYDDALYGVKSFYSLSLLARDAARSDELATAIGGIQAIQDSLPQAGDRRVRERFPVGVYNVIADFGQARGANTASILPNEADHTRKYGRTILLRYNIMTNPELFADSRAVYQAAVDPAHADDLTMEGTFYRTLWHEVGHYLGVAETDDGRALDTALAPWRPARGNEGRPGVAAHGDPSRRTGPHGRGDAALGPGRRRPSGPPARPPAARSALRHDAADAVQLLPRAGPARLGRGSRSTGNRLRPLPGGGRGHAGARAGAAGRRRSRRGRGLH